MTHDELLDQILAIVDAAIDVVQYSDRRNDVMHSTLATAIQMWTAQGWTVEEARKKLQLPEPTTFTTT